jgi:hypothetical protein
MFCAILLFIQFHSDTNWLEPSKLFFLDFKKTKIAKTLNILYESPLGNNLFCDLSLQVPSRDDKGVNRYK